MVESQGHGRGKQSTGWLLRMNGCDAEDEWMQRFAS